MSDLSTTDRLLLRAADNGELRYHHLESVAPNLFTYRGADVDVDTRIRVEQLISQGFLRVESAKTSGPVTVTGGGRLALLGSGVR